MENKKNENVLEIINEEKKVDNGDLNGPKISTPVAIIIAGFLIMIGFVLSGGSIGVNKEKDTSISGQLGINKSKFQACIENTDKIALNAKIQASVESAMKELPPEERGTPYSVIVGSNGSKSEIRGAQDEETVKILINEVLSGNVLIPYKGDVPAVDPSDHFFGNPEASVVVIEYSDFNCSFCARFHTTMKSIIDSSEGNVAWVYRHWPIQRNSIDKTIAAECAAEVKGKETFWEYADLLFELLLPKEKAVSDIL